MARVAVYTITRNREDLTRRSFKMLRLKAGMEFDHYVADNGSTDGTQKWLEGRYAAGDFKYYYPAGENLGQNIAANILLDQIQPHDEYEYILRWDPDAIPKSRRFLKRLVRCADAFRTFNLTPILSPKITKLEHPPEPLMAGDDVGFEYEVVQILGGICRLHPRWFFMDWRFNKFGALGFGEAKEVSERALDLNTPKLRLPKIIVEHAMGQKRQEKAYPDYFSDKWRWSYVGYGL